MIFPRSHSIIRSLNPSIKLRIFGSNKQNQQVPLARCFQCSRKVNVLSKSEGDIDDSSVKDIEGPTNDQTQHSDFWGFSDTHNTLTEPSSIPTHQLLVQRPGKSQNLGRNAKIDSIIGSGNEDVRDGVYSDVSSQSHQSGRFANSSHTSLGDFFDRQYFPDLCDTKTHIPTHTTQRFHQTLEREENNSNIFEDQFFSSLHENSGSNYQPETEESTLVKDLQHNLDGGKNNHQPTSTRTNDHDSNIFDDQYFSRLQEQDSEPMNQMNQSIASTALSESNVLNLSNVLKSSEHFSADSSSNFFDNQYFGKIDDGQNASSSDGDDGSNKDSDNIVVMGMTKRERKTKKLPKANIENPQTAYDMAIAIRRGKKMKNESVKSSSSSTDKQVTPRLSKWSGKIDSRGFRILENQTLELERFTSAEVIHILKDSVIYEDDKLVAIDKPYNLPSHGGPGVHHSVGRYLGELGEAFNAGDSLHLVHRLDRATTGVMLLAKSDVAYTELRGYFKRQVVSKIYWTITKGVPNPEKGIIDIPMAEMTVKGKARMGLRPNYSEQTKPLMKRARKVKKFAAVTEYSVLDSCGTAALVECRPQTGVKHQIRCHLAFGLNCGVLGDHKYSHFSKLAPQKLNPDMLQRLHVRQAKVRHVPMHLHARTLILPEYQDGRNVFISARLPRHFLQNMKWLGLRPPKL